MLNFMCALLFQTPSDICTAHKRKQTATTVLTTTRIISKHTTTTTITTRTMMTLRVTLTQTALDPRCNNYAVCALNKAYTSP